MKRVRLSPSASVTSTGAGVILRSDLGTFQITGADVGAFLGKMVPLLDGSRDGEEIMKALGGYSRDSVATFLGLLQKRGLIELVPETADRWRGQEEFFRSWAMSPAEATRRLAEARVICVGLPPWGAAAAIELAAAGIGAIRMIDAQRARREPTAAKIAAGSPWCRVEEAPLEALDAVASGGLPSLIVAAIPPSDAALIDRVTKIAHQAKVASLWLHVAGAKAVLGPLVTPGITACRVCANADGLNPPITERLRPAPASRAGATAQLLGHLAAIEAIRFIAGYSPSDLGGRVIIEDLTSRETALHTLVRLPWCRVCGDG